MNYKAVMVMVGVLVVLGGNGFAQEDEKGPVAGFRQRQATPVVQDQKANVNLPPQARPQSQTQQPPQQQPQGGRTPRVTIRR